MMASSNTFRIAAALLAASLLLLAVSANKAQAIFSGSNNAIAFVTNRDGSFQIYRMGSDGFGQSSLTEPPGESGDPAFSADGKKIAFASDRDGDSEVWRMKTNGTNLVNLSNNRSPVDDTFPTWQPIP